MTLRGIMLVNENDVLVSYDVTALFTNIPVDEAIRKPFNNTYDLHLERGDLVELLEVSVKNQLFQFDGEFYEQIDGVAMGSPLGPLLANTFMCSLEDKLQEEGKIPSYYKRYVDDTFAIMPNTADAYAFLEVLNSKHPALKFTMELATDNKLPFLGMNIIEDGTKLETIYKKPTNKGLLLHFDSHVDQRYKKGLLKTMLNRAYRLSSNWKLFVDECEAIKFAFSNLRYPPKLIDTTINTFITSLATGRTQNVTAHTSESNDTIPEVMFSLPFVNQKITENTRRQLHSLGSKIGVSLQPVFTSKKVGDILKT
ncbi:hypothetical protein ACROYT_G030228 [Oculina patagonica]